MLFIGSLLLEPLENSVVVGSRQHRPQVAVLWVLSLLGPDELFVELHSSNVFTGAVIACHADPRTAEAVATKVFAVATGGRHQVVATVSRSALTRDAEGDLAVDGSNVEPLRCPRTDRVQGVVATVP